MPVPPSLNGSSIDAVREPSVPSANALIGPMRIHSSPSPLRTPSASASSRRSAGSEAHTRKASAPSADSRCQAANPPLRWKSWTPVSPRRWASRTPLRTAASSSGSLGVGAASQRANASCSRRRPGAPSGRLGGHDRVPVVRRDGHRAATACDLERLGLERRRELVAHRVREHPAVAGAGLAQLRVDVVGAGRCGEIGLLARQRPLEEMHVRVVESRGHTAPLQVDSLGRDGRPIALANVHAARNACASNGDCACPRQTWVACEHRTALEDHRRRVATIAGSDPR